jgi:hypothetical protein
VTLQSSPIVPAAMLAGGVGAANFASSLATNTSYNPATPVQDAWADNRQGMMAQDMAQRLDAAQARDLPNTAAPQPTVPAVEPSATPTRQGMSQVDPIEAYLDRKAIVESSGRADARAKTSSATGLYQYTVARWLEIAPKALGERARGLSKRELLMKRLDPVASRIVADYDTRNELAPSLERAGVPITKETLYLAHFLGPTGARRLLTAKVGTPVNQVIDAKSIKANPFLKGKKAEEVLKWAQKKMRDA